MIDCTWDAPGANRFQGPVPQAVEKFSKEIPAEVRKALKARLEKLQYDEIVDITRDRISGTHEYTDLRMMLFGNGKLCKTVTRLKWSPQMLQRGLIFCEREVAGQRREFCLILPTVCSNLAMVNKGAPAALVSLPFTALQPDTESLPEGEDLVEYEPYNGPHSRAVLIPPLMAVPQASTGSLRALSAAGWAGPAWPVAYVTGGAAQPGGGIAPAVPVGPPAPAEPVTRPQRPTPNPVPEPAPLALIGAALLALAWSRKVAL